MKTLALLIVVVPSLATAQWTDSDTSPTVLNNSAGPQVQPKIKALSTGDAFLTWKENPGGGYDVRAQHLTFNGNISFPAAGLLVADRSYSSTQDYDLTVDLEGFGYVVFRDDRSGTGTQITVAKIAPAGNITWQTTLTPTAGSFNSPKLCVLGDGLGDLAVGWSTSTGFSMRRLSRAGVVLGSQVDVSEAGRTITLSDLEPGAGDEAIALWIRPFNTSFLSSKYLYCQKFDGAGTAMWNSGQPVQLYAPTGAPYGTQGGSVQNGYFPTIQSDGVGGFACAWYENAGLRRAYLQHIDAQGNKLMGQWGSPIATTAGRMQLGAALAFDPWTEAYYVAAQEANITPETNYSVICQRMDKQGNRLWGDSGITVRGVNGFQKSFVQAQMTAGGPNFFFFEFTSSVNQVVLAAGLSPNGAERFGVSSTSLVSSLGSPKSRLHTELAPHGGTLAVWGDGNSDTDIHGARIEQNGALGNAGTEMTGTLNENGGFGPMHTVPWIVELVGDSGSETHRVFSSATNTLRYRTQLNGVVDVFVSGPHWLRKQVATLDLSAPTPWTASLVNGDVNSDNEVGPADFTGLSGAFGTAPGDANWIRNADLNGDLEVGPADFTVLSQNFGTIGD